MIGILFLGQQRVLQPAHYPAHYPTHAPLAPVPTPLHFTPIRVRKFGRSVSVQEATGMRAVLIVAGVRLAAAAAAAAAAACPERHPANEYLVFHNVKRNVKAGICI